jgi:Ran GTPase-activating protein (RanGAP) involved in mRNA processing and transport
VKSIDKKNNNIHHPHFILSVSKKNTDMAVELDISDRRLGADGALALAESLAYSKQNVHLERLDLSSNALRFGGIAALTPVLVFAANLRHLILSNNEICNKGARELAAFLAFGCQALETLDLSCNGIGSRGALALARSLKGARQLRVLRLSHNDLGCNGAIAISALIGKRYVASLESLDLACNGIRDKGASSLALAFRRARALKDVVLSTNSIGDPVAAQLILSLSRSVETLDFARNGLGRKSAGALARLRSIRRLDVSSNQMCAEALSCSIGRMSELQYLHLGFNELGDSGATALLPALRLLQRLEHVDLSFNDICGGVSSKLTDELADCKVVVHNSDAEALTEMMY